MKNFLLRLFGAAVLAVAVAAVLTAVLSFRQSEQPIVDTSAQATEITDLGGAYKIWFSGLSNEGKTAYNLILRSIYDMPEEIEINRIDSETLDKVFYALMGDNPDLFFVGRKCTLRTVGSRTWFSVDYLVSRQEYASMKKELDAVRDGIIASLGDSSDPWQTELAIHDYIIDNCVYSSENTLLESSAYGALVKGKAACEGYSKAAKLLLDAAGIENTLVSGNSRSANGQSGPHMWNAVRLQDGWYHLDCTWDDPVDETGEQTKSYVYFNVDDKMISQTHSDFSKNFGCNSMKENYFVKTGAYFESYDRSSEKTIAEIIARETAAGRETVYLRFADREAYDKAVGDLIDNERIYNVLELAKNSAKAGFSTKTVGYFVDEDRLILALAPKNEK